MNDSNIKNINRVVDYIQNNLDSVLSIEKLSSIGALSHFHFTRVFKDAVGETVHQYIKRLRVEKAAGLLLTKRSMNITEIAMKCGFGTSSSFAKGFRQFFKMSATEWRDNCREDFNPNSKPVQIEKGKISSRMGDTVWTFGEKNNIRQVVVEDLPREKIAYIRNIGPYEGDGELFENMYDELFRWAAPRNLLGNIPYSLNIYHDYHKITQSDKHRLMVAIPVSSDVKASGKVGITETAGGKYGICRFFLCEDEFGEAWDWLSEAWLKNSGFEWDERETLERSYSEKKIDGKHYYDIDICIPVKIPS